MSIYFRYRRTKHEMNSSFSLYNGANITNPDHWHVGDQVSVIFNMKPEEMQQLRASLKNQNEIVNYDNSIHVRCVVVQRSHAVSWREVGRFQMLAGTNVALEASTKRYEDVLLWIMFEQKPKWFINPGSAG